MRMPAQALEVDPATDLPVWYQAKAEATFLLPPRSASSTLAAGSRSAMETPCKERMAKSCQGALAKTSRSETRLRSVAATSSVRRGPKRSAVQPSTGLRPMATALLIDMSTPTSASESPSERA